MIVTDPKLERNDIEVFNFIVRFKQAHNGNSPSMYEIEKGTCASSRSHVHYVLRKLEEAGYLKMGKNQRSRGIQIPGTKWVTTDQYREPALDFVRN